MPDALVPEETLMNVFLVTSPLQLLNALEAQRHFRLPVEVCDLLLLVRGSPGNRQQLTRLVDASDWNRMHVVSRSRGNGFLDWLSMQKRLAAFGRGPVERLFVGNYLSELQRPMVRKLAPRSVWSLDDGTATLWVDELRRKIGQCREETRLRLAPLLRRILFGVKDAHVDRLNYFTIYPVHPRPGEEVVKNTYERLRDLPKSWQRIEEVYFLGEPYSEDKIMPSVEVYMHYLEDVREHFGDSPMVYLPHRREDAGKLKVIERGLGVTIKSFGMPVEYALCKHGLRAACIGSFVSSALGNCQVIFRGTVPIKSFQIHPKDVRSSSRPQFEEYYRYYRTLEVDGLRVVGLDADGRYEDDVARR
jgi:hypothetical protein